MRNLRLHGAPVASYLFVLYTFFLRRSEMEICWILYHFHFQGKEMEMEMVFGNGNGISTKIWVVV